MKRTALILAIAAAGITSAFADVPPPSKPKPVPEAVSTFSILSSGLLALAAGRRLFK